MYQPLIHAPNFECQLSPEAVAELIPSKKISLPKAAKPAAQPANSSTAIRVLLELVGTLIFVRHAVQRDVKPRPFCNLRRGRAFQLARVWGLP